MSALGSLVVKLALEYAQFSKGLESNEQEVKQHAKRVQDTYEQMAAGVAARMDSLKGAVLGAIGGAVSAFGLTSAIAKIKQETIDAEKEQQQLAAAIKSTGGAAGWSVEQLNEMADSLEKHSNFSAGQINQAQARMLSYSGVVGKVMPRAMQAVVDMSERMGYQVTAAAETIGKALDVPSAGLSALSEQGFRFTAEQKEMVKQLERTGQTAKAQEIILNALEASYGGAAQAARDTLGGALQAVTHAVDSLMTADSASLPGLRDSVNGLAETLSGESVRAGFQAFIGVVADVGTFAASSMAKLVELGQAAAEHKGEIGVVLGMLAGAGTAAGALKVAAAIGGAGGIVGALGKARAAVLALSIALASNPATLVLLGIGAATGAAIAANLADPVGDKLTKEIEFQTERLAQAEALLERAGGPKGQMTAKLEARIDGIRTHLDALRTAAGVAKPAVQEVADQVSGVADAANSSEKPLGQSEEWLKKYGTTAQKAAVEIEEWKRKLGSAFTPEMERQIRDFYAKQDEGAKASAQSAKQLQTAYEGLTKSLDEKIAEQTQELQSGDKLTESDKQRIKFAEELKGSLKGLSAAQRANVLAQIDSLAALEKENEARKDFLRHAEEDRKRRQDIASAAEQNVQSLIDGNKTLREEIELIGLSAAQQANVLARRQEAILLIKEQQLAEMERASAASGFNSREQLALMQEIELLRERLSLTRDKQIREATATATAENVADWQKGVDQIGQSLSDQLMEGGRSFGDYMRNLGRTLVFTPIIKAIVQPAAGNVASGLASMLGLNAGTASQSSGSGGPVSWLSGVKTAYNAFDASLLTDFGTGLGMNINKLGTKLFEKGLEKAGESLMDLGVKVAEYGDVINTAGSVLSYGKALFDLSKGRYGSAIGTAVGQWFGGPIGATIGSFLGTSLDKAFGSRGANHAGAAYSTAGGSNDQAAAQLFGRAAGDWYDDLTQRHSADLGKQLGTTVNALSGVYKSLAKYAGDSAKQIDIVAGFAVNPVHGDEDSYGYFRLINQLTGETLKDYTARDGVLGADPEKAWAQYVADMGSALVAEIKTADIPGWMRSVFDGLDDEITLEGLTAALQEIAALDGVLTSMRRNLQGFGSLADSTFTALLKHAGGLEQLSAGVSAYYEQFYSEGERAANVTRDVTEALAAVGIEMPRTRAEFRAIVEANAALGDAGARTVAAMLGVADAFASVVPESEAVADSLGRAMQGLLDERRKLEADLLRAQGDEAAYLAATRAIATDGYNSAELAAWDYNEALRKQISEAQAAASATEAAAQAMAAMREQADSIVREQRDSLDGLLASLRRQEQQEEGGFVGSLWLSGSEFTQFSAFADQLDGAAGALAQLRTLGLGDELAGYVEQIGAIVRQTEQVLAAELSAQRLRAGDTAGALAAAVSANMPRYADFSAGGQFQAGAFNDAMARQRGQAAAGLLASAQANALSIPNSAAVIAQLKGEVMAYTQESVLRELRVQGAEMFGPMVNGLLTGLWEGMARGAAEGKLLAGNVGSVGWMPGYGTVVGEDLQLVARSIDTINQAFANGRITVQEAEAALEYLNATFGDLIPLLSDTAAQFGRAADAAAAQARAGITSLQGVFGQLSGIVAGMDEAARKANTSLSQATNAIGLLGSMSTEFGKAAAGSVDAAMSAIGMYADAAALAQQKEEWGQADMYARSAQELRLQLPELRAAEVRGKLVSDAAALAASILTTADAARAAKELEGKITLGEGQTLRDLTLLVDGLGQYDNTAFYESFARVTDALGKGQITEAQYSTLFDYMVTTYQGVDQEAERAAQALAALQSAAGSLADELLLGDYSSFSAKDKAAEAVRQYDEVISAALAGGDVAQGELAKATNTMLQKVRDSTTDPLEMERRFGLTINQLRAVEKAPEVSPEVKQLQALQKEVVLLRTELTKALAAVKEEGQGTNRLLREAAAKKG
nr:phage tail length tape measure family protein [Delftia sp. PS-11]KAJ8745431.1 phage tail length tape measure family protein [Delftia sp. PS-11]